MSRIFLSYVGLLSLGWNVAWGANETSGIYTSPGYPSPFPSYSTQNTRIELPGTNTTVFLHFEKLDLRSTSSSNPALLRVYDGTSSSSEKIAEFTGNTVSFDVESTTNNMYLTFSSNSYPGAAGSGVYATYTTVNNHYNLSDGTGSISTPNYPNPYPDSEVIHWTIRQPTYAFTRVEIHDFETEECCDSLSVRNGPTSSSAELQLLAGDNGYTPFTFMSTEKAIFLRFISNGFSSGRGFNATYHPGFRYILGGSSGEVKSLNFPSNYTTYLAEQWVITVPFTNMSVLLEFKSFDTELGDLLTIRNGDRDTSPIVGQYSGSQLPPIYISSANKLFVSFVSRDGATNRGIFATYLAVYRSDYTTTTQAPICTEDGVYRIPFPGFCEKYYQCVNYHAYEQSCAPGMFFDPAMSECNFADLVDCPWFTTFPTTEPSVCPPDGIEFIPIPGDCTSYILCAEGIPQVQGA
ncbi:tolloid-like protein 2 [Folsomia candida]|uniref:tolloid-like protein 2 n=1 Tax=Folsomia candida TaxID=158441 RepID=UPI000B903BC9|nr:tolloid-like protein 2 [Folsomia candida]